MGSHWLLEQLRCKWGPVSVWTPIPAQRMLIFTIATLPACQEYKTGFAAALASRVKELLPNHWFGLFVNIASQGSKRKKANTL